jgi:hypothetical protein
MNRVSTAQTIKDLGPALDANVSIGRVGETVLQTIKENNVSLK